MKNVELASPLRLMLTFLPPEEEGTRQIMDVEDTNVKEVCMELKFARIMRQTVVELLNNANEWFIVTFTAPNRENGGSKTTPSSRAAGDIGEEAADEEGNEVTGGAGVPEEIADVAGEELAVLEEIADVAGEELVVPEEREDAAGAELVVPEEREDAAGAELVVPEEIADVAGAELVVTEETVVGGAELVAGGSDVPEETADVAGGEPAVVAAGAPG